MADVSSLFSRIAPVYDALNHLFSFGTDRTWRAALVGASAPSGKVILDVCTGTGDVAIALAQAGATVVGVDFSPGMLALGERKRARAVAGDRIVLTQGDAQDLSFENGTFDAVTIAFGLRNIPDRDRAVAEMIRVLKPGGDLLMLEFAPPPPSVFGRVFRLYLERLIPWIGRLISGSRGAYQYLFTSIVAFEHPQTVMARLTTQGLTRPRSLSLMGGIVYLYRARKPTD